MGGHQRARRWAAGSHLQRAFVEGDDVFEHLGALVEGAVLVVLGERVLLQEVVLQVPRRLQRDLVALRQRVLCPRVQGQGLGQGSRLDTPPPMVRTKCLGVAGACHDRAKISP